MSPYRKLAEVASAVADAEDRRATLLEEVKIQEVLMATAAEELDALISKLAGATSSTAPAPAAAKITPPDAPPLEDARRKPLVEQVRAVIEAGKLEEKALPERWDLTMGIPGLQSALAGVEAQQNALAEADAKKKPSRKRTTPATAAATTQVVECLLTPEDMQTIAGAIAAGNIGPDELEPMLAGHGVKGWQDLPQDLLHLLRRKAGRGA